MSAASKLIVQQAPSLNVDIIVEDPRWESVTPNIVEAISGFLPVIAANLEGFASDAAISACIMLSNNADVQELNRDYRNKDKPTNVLSFPQYDYEDLPEAGEFNIGDIAIAYETIEQEAADDKISIHDHTLHMVVHGILHLCGYDHIEEDEAEVMEALEVKILGQINIENPYKDE